jgi:hypothetical protein
MIVRREYKANVIITYNETDSSVEIDSDRDDIILAVEHYLNKIGILRDLELLYQGQMLDIGLRVHIIGPGRNL